MDVRTRHLIFALISQRNDAQNLSADLSAEIGELKEKIESLKIDLAAELTEKEVLNQNIRDLLTEQEKTNDGRA